MDEKVFIVQILKLQKKIIDAKEVNILMFIQFFLETFIFIH